MAKKIKCLTIQHKSILENLKKGYTHKIDESTFLKYVPENRREAYENMKKMYGWEFYPIFLGEIGKKTEMSGARLDDCVILELSIPSNYIKRQKFYDWSDYIYFLELPEEFKDVFTCSFEEFEKEVMFPSNLDKSDAIQITVPCLMPEWLKSAFDITPRFEKKYIYSGGNNVLEFLRRENYIFF